MSNNGDGETKTLYALGDPITGAVRYIGATKNIKQRYSQHRHSKRGANKKVGKWIRGLRKKGEEPTLFILDEVPKSEARQREKDLENVFRLLGFRTGYHLLNGGRAPVKFEEVDEEPYYMSLWYWRCKCGRGFPSDGRRLKEHLLRIENPVAPGERDIYVCPECGRDSGFKYVSRYLTWTQYWSTTPLDSFISSS